MGSASQEDLHGVSHPEGFLLLQDEGNGQESLWGWGWALSKISSYLQVDKLVSCGFMDAGRRHKTPRPETKDGLLLRAMAEARVSGFAQVL